MSVQNICTFTTDQPVKVLYVIQVLVQVESNNHVPFFQISSGGLRRSTSHENKSRQHPKHKYRISWKDRHTFSPQISISKLGVNSSGDKNSHLGFRPQAIKPFWCLPLQDVWSSRCTSVKLGVTLGSRVFSRLSQTVPSCGYLSGVAIFLGYTVLRDRM